MKIKPIFCNLGIHRWLDDYPYKGISQCADCSLQKKKEKKKFFSRAAKCVECNGRANYISKIGLMCRPCLYSRRRDYPNFY